MPATQPPRNPAFRGWTEEEEAIIRAHYAQKGTKILPMLPGRTIQSVAKRAQVIGVQRLRPWTENEKMIVRDSWGRSTLEELARRVNRPESAVYQYAMRYLGLCGEDPQGLETIDKAAKRTGYSPQTLQRIFYHCGVHMFKPLNGPRRYVDRESVDEAVAYWLMTETITEAAHRRGMCGKQLRSWVLAAQAAGVCELPAQPAKTRHWRIPTEALDRVLEWEASLLTTPQIARRAGVSESTVLKWYHQAGMRKFRGNWYVTEDDATALIKAHAEERAEAKSLAESRAAARRAAKKRGAKRRALARKRRRARVARAILRWAKAVARFVRRAGIRERRERRANLAKARVASVQVAA